MDVVADAVGVMRAQLAILSEACDGLSHRELVSLLSEVTTLVRGVPALEHQILARLTGDRTAPAWGSVLEEGADHRAAGLGERGETPVG